MDYSIYWHFAHNHYSCSKIKSSGIWTCSLSGLISSLFSFGVYIFLNPLIFLLGLITLFLAFLLFFHFFKIWENKLHKSKVCTYLQDYKSQFKNYESNYYRTLTQGKACGGHGVGSGRILVVSLVGGRVWILCMLWANICSVRVL